MRQYTVSDYQRLVERLKTARMPGFRPFALWRCICVTAYRGMYVPHASQPESALRRAFRLLSSAAVEFCKLAFRRYRLTGIENVRDHTILFLSSHYVENYRADMQQTMQTVSEVSDEPALVRVEKTTGFAPNPWYLILVLVWLAKINSLDVHTALKCDLMRNTAKAYLFRKCLQKNAKAIRTANALLTLNDENCDENLFVQFCKRSGIPTATLQHGHMWNTKPSEELMYYAHNFKELTADYFFAWGQYTCDLAVKDGVSPDRMIPVGVPKYIGVTEKLPILHEKVFGVFFDTPFTGLKTNKDMAKYANFLAETYGYSFYVKLHPIDSAEQYSGLFNAHFLGFAKPCSVQEFSRTVDFSILCTSTVFFEQIYFNKPVFRYLPPDSIDVFEGLTLSAFSDERQLRELMELYINDEQLFLTRFGEMAEYCCGKGDIAENYRNAIHWLNSLNPNEQRKRETK